MVQTSPLKPTPPRPPQGGIRRKDGRTKEARFLRAAKADLTAKLGKAPTPAQTIMIERAAAVSLTLALLDEKLGQMTDAEARDHLRTTNAYFRLISRLLAPPKQRHGRPRKALAATPPAPDAPNPVLAYLKARQHA